MLRLPRADMGALPARYGAVSMLLLRFDAVSRVAKGGEVVKRCRDYVG